VTDHEGGVAGPERWSYWASHSPDPNGMASSASYRQSRWRRRSGAGGNGSGSGPSAMAAPTIHADDAIEDSAPAEFQLDEEVFLDAESDLLANAPPTSANASMDDLSRGVSTVDLVADSAAEAAGSDADDGTTGAVEEIFIGDGTWAAHENASAHKVSATDFEILSTIGQGAYGKVRGPAVAEPILSSAAVPC